MSGGMETVMRTAVGLAEVGAGFEQSRRALLAASRGDRTALEVAHAVLLRDGLPRRSGGRSPGRARGLRNRALNLLEFALEGGDGGAPARATPGQFEWSAAVMETTA